MTMKDGGHLAVRKTLALAWQDVLANRKAGLVLLLLAAIPGLLLSASGFLQTLFFPAAGTPSLAMAIVALLVALAMLLYSVGIYVLFIRVFLTGGEAAFCLSFRTLVGYTLRFIWNTFLLGLLLILFTIVLILPLLLVMAILFALLGVSFGDPQAPGSLAMATPALIIVVEFVLYAFILVRYFPTLFGATVGQRVRFRESWRTMDGYTWPTLLALAPPFLLALAIQAVGIWSMWQGYAAGLEGMAAMTGDLWWLSLVALPFTYISYGWGVAVLANIYRDMWPAAPASDTSLPSETSS